MKIIHLISGGDVGGAKTHVLSLLEGLGRTQTVRLVCFTAGAFADDAKAMGIDTLVLDGGVRSSIRALERMIQEERFDIVHCHGSRANMIGAILKRTINVPIVTTVHSDYRLDYLGRPFHRLTYGTINTISLRMFDYHIGVSDAMVQLLISRGFNPQKLFSIYNGVAFPPEKPSLSRGEYLESLGVSYDEDTVVFGIAARLNPVKDIATLIRGFAGACRKCPNIRLVIAGDGEERQMLESLAKETCPVGSVVFAGWVKDTDSFYHAIDVNMLTSLSEGSPYALVEGARMRCATIATSVGGIPYMMESGVTGLLFTPRDVETLTSYMVRLVENPAFRRKLGENFYEKAEQVYSAEATVRHQLDIYRTILRQTARPKEKRRGVMICGAYGKGNAGDDAILKAILAQMKAIDRDMPVYVMSHDPAETRLRYHVGSVHVFDPFRFWPLMRRCRLFISGGGSLIQNETSTRSLNYYLTTIRMAHTAGCRVMMYGCGIGPINRPGNRRMAARTIDASVDRITLRDDNSRALLAEMGVTRPDIRVSADPTIILTPAPREIVNIALEQSGIDPNGKYIGFGLRNWKGLDTALPEIAAAANYAYEKHGLTPVFVPIEFPSDLMPAERVGALLHCPWHAVRTRQPIEVTIGILSRMKTVVGIRLHSLMFSAGQGVPVVGMSYDIKVDGFLKYIGSRTCLQLSSVKAEPLCRLIDECVSGALDNEVHRTAEMLRERESENVKGAAKLLNISEN